MIALCVVMGQESDHGASGVHRSTAKQIGLICRQLRD
jgi:hypothetical protein